jgi:hypothetical protein
MINLLTFLKSKNFNKGKEKLLKQKRKEYFLENLKNFHHRLEWYLQWDLENEDLVIKYFNMNLKEMEKRLKRKFV